jgi:hypothetical protein
MQQDATALEPHTANYYRRLSYLALAVKNGSDLRRLVDASPFVTDHELAALVPFISKQAPRLSPHDLQALRWCPPFSPAGLHFVAIAFARHCLRRDVLAALAAYYDPSTASRRARRLDDGDEPAK